MTGQTKPEYRIRTWIKCSSNVVEQGTIFQSVVTNNQYPSRLLKLLHIKLYIILIYILFRSLLLWYHPISVLSPKKIRRAVQPIIIFVCASQVSFGFSVWWRGDQRNHQCIWIHRCCVLIHVCFAFFSSGWEGVGGIKLLSGYCHGYGHVATASAIAAQC